MLQDCGLQSFVHSYSHNSILRTQFFAESWLKCPDFPIRETSKSTGNFQPLRFGLRRQRCHPNELVTGWKKNTARLWGDGKPKWMGKWFESSKFIRVTVFFTVLGATLGGSYFWASWMWIDTGHMNPKRNRTKRLFLGGGFETFRGFYLWGNDAIWPEFFKWVETTPTGFGLDGFGGLCLAKLPHSDCVRWESDKNHRWCL